MGVIWSGVHEHWRGRVGFVWEIFGLEFMSTGEVEWGLCGSYLVWSSWVWRGRMGFMQELFLV